mmetsp:Transcript_30417/g.34669  ORF Transcript_30417/g.34669 Transcript_30417/m.34669 type:complete len:897 (-) Transcript_30417:272-2962(-)
MMSATTKTSSVPVEERLNSLLISNQFSVASYLDIALQDIIAKEQPADESKLDSSNNEELQRRMAELALQLQLQTQTCHEEIGRIGAELQAILPRCATDIGRVGLGLEGIRLDASQLLNECAQLQNVEVSSSLETLSTLHALRSNLSHTKDILQAAATWDSTLDSIAALLAQPNLPAAVLSLAQLEAGERALQGMPSGLEERKKALEEIRVSVQALLQPQLQHALQTMHTRLAPLQQCVQLYQSLDKMDALQKEYIANRPSNLHKAWFAYRGSSTTGVNTGIKSVLTNDSFITWLPTWYDAVLSLLTEERRQSLSVFGPNTAPYMVSKVLAECFRPLIGSFSTRLDTLTSTNNTQTSNNGSSQLESICTLYEATLQFLSLAYETVAGGWHDVADATTASGTEVYRHIAKVFGQISSPFAPYQQSLAQMERQHSYSSQTLIQKDIQQAVGSISQPTVAALQDATEKLQNLASFVFPMAEAALARLELLTGGYQVCLALESIDSMLNNHASELAVAIQTLSATMSTNLASSFNDMHVSSSLEILKVAGFYQNSLSDFEFKTRERMAVLQQRRVTHNMLEKEVSEDSKSFLLPDALSVVEIDSILTKAALLVEENSCRNGDNDSPGALLRLSNNDFTLFPHAAEAFGRLKRSCHTLIFQVCSAVPCQNLKDMSSMDCWTKSSSSLDSLDSYGTLPQPYITQVGEHMLALVQALEPFASSAESLAIAKRVMLGVRKVVLQPWRDLFAAIGVNDDSTVLESFMEGTALYDYIERSFDDEDLEEDEITRAQHDFCNQWLDVVGLAITGRLLERILCIPRLSSKGCEHLATDLNYLANVLAALGVTGHPHPLVSHISDLCYSNETKWKEMLKERQPKAVGSNKSMISVLCAVEERFAAMRGIAI